ncbi:hypothetical protein DPX16_7224 [Anabarilius grahami]|uniref:Uncharacterized protein n=1 Tax=Anabarilius grahami TaxID=495550 RepID=A0A3N0XMS6_ANAGA|nr:hypothetical protein DPX16_7224 [Anabarilius grahami]
MAHSALYWGYVLSIEANEVWFHVSVMRTTAHTICSGLEAREHKADHMRVGADHKTTVEQMEKGHADLRKDKERHVERQKGREKSEKVRKKLEHKKRPEGWKQTYNNKTASWSVAYAGVFVFLLYSVKPFLLRGQEPPANPPRAPSNAH